MCTSVGRLRWLPVGPHLRRGVYANTSRLALLQDPAAPRVYATLEIAVLSVRGFSFSWISDLADPVGVSLFCVALLDSPKDSFLRAIGYLVQGGATV